MRWALIVLREPKGVILHRGSSNFWCLLQEVEYVPGKKFSPHLLPFLSTFCYYSCHQCLQRRDV